MGDKGKMYVTYLRPIVMYICETWPTTQGDEKRLFIFERKVLRKIYGPVRNESTGVYEKRKNTILESLYNKPSINYFLKSKCLRWAHWRKHNWKVLINKPAGKLPSERPRQRWQFRVNADIRMIDGTADIETASYREVWRGLV